MPGLELDDILTGVSVCRNQNLANVFYRLQLIEAYGTRTSIASWKRKSNEISSALMVQQNRSPRPQSWGSVFVKSLLSSIHPSLQVGYSDILSSNGPNPVPPVFHSGIY